VVQSTAERDRRISAHVSRAQILRGDKSRYRLSFNAETRGIPQGFARVFLHARTAPNAPGRADLEL
jgi:hypothetical protein